MATTQRRADNLLKYANIAASTLRDIADSSTTPFLKTIAGLSISILEIAQAVRANQDACLRMVSQIDELLSFILELCVKGDDLPPIMLHNLGKFAETLQKVHSFMKSQQNANVLKRIFRQSENASLLEECNMALKHTLRVFGVETSVFVITEMAEMRELAEKRHQDLIHLFQSEFSDVGDSDTSSLISRNLFELGNSTTSLVLLPAAPKIFHGRDSELGALVNLLLQDSPRATILGPGGIGKTSLATAVLHHPEIISRYADRHFVSCESAASRDDLVSIVASHIAVSPTRNTAKRIVRHFSDCAPCVLLLDNLETSWEPLGSRGQVEEFLSQLTDIPHLALMVTMRGAERPAKVKWSRPFLPQLEPLSDAAARQTFADIADEDLTDAEVRDLLEVTNNVPLAVNLVANIAAFEGYGTVLLRWKAEKTTLFSGGVDKRSNLDLSIRISLSSPRMLDSPGAHALLSLLSLLPDGISDADLLQSDFSITDMGHSKTTLLRTSLAYLDHDRRLRVLAPIREYIRSNDPPSPSLCRPLRQHFHRLILLWKDYQHLSTATITQRIVANAGNFHAVLSHGLDWGEPDLKETLSSIMTFDSFYRVSGRRSSGMLELLPEYLERLGDDRLHGEYMTVFVLTWQYHPLGDVESLERNAIQHLRVVQDKSSEAKFLCALASYFLRHDHDIPKALRYYETAFALATEVNDVETQCFALRDIADGTCTLGRYQEAQAKAREMRTLAQGHGLFYMEAHSLRVELLCRTYQGDLAPCVALSTEGRALLALCGLEGSTLDLMLVNAVAEVHLQKTEYAEARALYSRTHADQAPSPQAYDRLNLVVIDAETGVDSAQVRGDLKAVRATFEALKIPHGVIFCDIIRAYVDIRDGLLDEGRLELERAFVQTRGSNQEISIFCLTKLGDITCGLADTATTLEWAVILMAFALKGNTIAVYHALRCLGDIFLAQGDEGTSLTLWEVSLAGFTATDIHRSRAECMLRIGDMFQCRGSREKAVEMWMTARPLFARSLQAREVAQVDERLE
ncbi:hypothetical protein C8R46DRAFT_375208 [Mycena filopes]|nr:hypothetical protein C8R46DRAFT_375208 [Mycena filopes]